MLTVLFSIVPESFRWLVSHGRIKRAQQTIEYVAKFNRKPVPDLKKLASVIGENRIFVFTLQLRGVLITVECTQMVVCLNLYVPI